MDALTERQLDYIRKATGNKEQMNFIADLLFHHGMLSYAEMACIQCVQSPQDKARTLVDAARMKSDAVSDMFMTTWESYGSPEAPDGATASRARILEVLEEMDSGDLEKLKFSMREIEVDGRQPFALVNPSGLCNTTEIAAVISGHGDDPRAALTVLLRAIPRNDLL